VHLPKKCKSVTLISSLCFGDVIDRETGNQLKPQIVTFYNRTKSGIDTVNQMCLTFSVA
jgi:hypothetical protein